ncbi:MAG: hypothetical protein ABL994_12875 [Verrucomicrobiales bacterium]
MHRFKILLLLAVLTYVGLVTLRSEAFDKGTFACLFAASAAIPLLIKAGMRGNSMATMISFFATPALLCAVVYWSDKGSNYSWFPLSAAFALAFAFPVWTVACILMHRET